MTKKLLKNCTLPDDRKNFQILIEDGQIAQISQNNCQIPCQNIIDMMGKIVIPGFIDVHIHGAGGGEFFKGETTEFQKATTTLLNYGVTGLTPTTIVNPENNFQQLTLIKETLEKGVRGARLLGLHLEGPFVNRKRKGGIPGASVLDYDRETLLKILNLLGDKLKMMTIAPEISPRMEIIDILLDHGIVPALGHTDINYADAHRAFEKGVRHVTHIFNAMPVLHHREPGPLLAIFERKDVSVQIISDGVHLDPAIVRYLYTSLGIDNCVCVSDGQSVIGLPDGDYDINGGIYQKNGEKATDKDGNLIGTALDVGHIAGKFQRFTGCSQKEAIQSVALNPAKVLGLQETTGALEAGMRADLVVLDSNGEAERVFLYGEPV
ncbi:MAG: N-acetylglucosamine-6-phosphate deacetylase [Candidatus Marinimicrobia bacterium]|nr:N-acetylglucosamine-6-phosphate deacetylase [Candidatus Neomarinimicrobiota bacterium]